MIKPAYHIFLDVTQKRLIADIAAIQSQIEWLMQLTVKHLLECNPDTARLLMGSTNIRVLADSWLAVVLENSEDQDVEAWMHLAHREIASLAQDRNAYLHTLYAHQDGDTPDDYNVAVAHEPRARTRTAAPAAIRIRNNKAVDLSGLRAARDRAARASVLFAHIEWLSMDLDAPSPFQRRLSSLYPLGPALPEDQKASRRKRQPQASLG